MSKQRNELIRITIEAVPKTLDLENLVRGVNQGAWAGAVPTGATHEQAVTAIVDAAIRERWISGLVGKLAEKYPGRTEFGELGRGIAEEMMGAERVPGGLAAGVAAGGPVPTRASLRKVLGEVLRTDADFNAFAMDHFPEIHHRFAGGMDRVQKTNLLLELAEPNDLYGKLSGKA